MNNWKYQAYKLFLLILVVLLLTSCSQRGNEIHTDSMNPSPGLQSYRYEAQHNILEYYEDLNYVCVENGKIYYITHIEVKNALQTVFILDPKTGNTKMMETIVDFNKKCKQERGSKYILHQLSVAPDNTLLLLASWQSERLDSDSKTMWLLKLNEKGYVESEIPLSVDAQQVWSDPCLFYDGNGYCYFIEASGITIFDQELRELGKITDNVTSLTRTGNGEVIALVKSSDGTFWNVRSIDAINCKLSGNRIIYNASDNLLAGSQFYPGMGEFDLFCATDLSLYGYTLGSNGQPGNGEQLLSWLNCDVEGTALIALGATDEGFVCATFSEFFGAETAVLRKQDSFFENTQVLTLACRKLPSTVAQMVLRFNRQGNGYRVEIKDYGAVAASAGLGAGIDQMTVDLLSGNVPDIFCTDQLDVQILIDRGLLEDLWPYIDDDHDLGGRSALVQPVFNAIERNGKLYQITDSFRVHTAFALNDIVGDEPGWSVTELQEICVGQELYRISNGTQESVLESIISLCAEKFIDREKHTSSFSSQEFVQLLEFAEQYPSRLDDNIEDTYWLAEGKQLFYEGAFPNLSVWMRQKWKHFGTDQVTCIGFPGAPGNGSAFVLETPMAMSATCENKDAAWSFMRMLLLPETQQFPSLWNPRINVLAMPTNMEEYQAMIREALTGKTVPFFITGLGKEKVELPEWSQEEADSFWDFLSGITIVKGCDDAVEGIIRDEATLYFAGRQTAQAAADNIQSRVELYIAERE